MNHPRSHTVREKSRAGVFTSVQSLNLYEKNSSKIRLGMCVFCTDKRFFQKKARQSRGGIIFSLCMPSWLLCSSMFLTFFFFVAAKNNHAHHIRTFVAHFSNPAALDNFLSKQRCHSLLHRSSCTDVGRIPNFIPILSACQIWKGEAGQKIIGRTSHKSECGCSRCG